jgi:transcriptional regulator with XRE-family HTH domain
MTGKELRAVRSRLGLTQGQLAQCLRTTLTTVARWERGEVSISEPIALLVGYVAKEYGVEAAHGQRGRGAARDKAAHRGKARDSDRKSRGRPRS